jgi:tetratricopeptide (TPR) repeat protein
MDCPRCGARDVSEPECPACGVILARARPPRRPAPRSARAAPRRALSPSTGILVLTLAGALAAAVLAHRFSSVAPPPEVATAPAKPEPRTPPPPRPAEDADRRPATSSSPPPDPGPPSLPPDTAGKDRRIAERLARLLSAHLAVSPADLQAGEDLYSRYGGPARSLLEALLLSAAARERQGRRYAEAEALLSRASMVAPDSPRPPLALLSVLLDSGDWHGAENAARVTLGLSPAEGEAARGLAFALLRQDRRAEATEALSEFLAAHDDPETRAFLERLRRDAAPESGLTEQRLAHFHVRYDGEAHEDVGREILRVLDRHYATLVRTFDYEPRSPIPVILLSRRTYDQATGAPWWSGGLYDSFDGRVRIPIGDLTTALTPDLDGALLHELTHAFVTDCSQGVAPREIQEGLAQYLEGKRIESLLGEQGLRALADGRLRGVPGFYATSLALVEHLMAQRGQGGINDLLRTMAETGSADQAFERVYGQDLAGLRREWAVRFRQQHGS